MFAHKLHVNEFSQVLIPLHTAQTNNVLGFFQSKWRTSQTTQNVSYALEKPFWLHSVSDVWQTIARCASFARNGSQYCHRWHPQPFSAFAPFEFVAMDISAQSLNTIQRKQNTCYNGSLPKSWKKIFQRWKGQLRTWHTFSRSKNCTL